MKLYASKFHWQENLYGGRTLQIYIHVVSCWTKVRRLGRNCHAHWHQPDPNFRLEDVWRSGKLFPLDHPEILYLPPSLPGSTPKKSNLISSQAREENPELEDMNHQELVDLVKVVTGES